MCLRAPSPSRPMAMDNFPRTPEEIYEDYAARRSGMLRALTDGQ